MLTMQTAPAQLAEHQFMIDLAEVYEEEALVEAGRGFEDRARDHYARALEYRTKAADIMEQHVEVLQGRTVSLATFVKMHPELAESCAGHWVDRIEQLLQ